MQIIIRILGAGIPVFDFVAGEVNEGQFKAFSGSDLHDHIVKTLPALENLVVFDDLLGTQAYLKPYSLGSATAFITAHPRFSGMQFYPNFIVFNIEDHVETKEKDA